MVSKVKHFEELWEEAESLSFMDEDSVFISIIDEINNLKQNPQNIGKVLLLLSFISKKHNIDVYHLLKKEIDQIKIDNWE
jgi:hypothetical protein